MKVAIVTTRHGAQDDRIYYKEALSLAKRMQVVMIAPDDGEKLEWSPLVAYRPIPRRRSAIGRLWSLFEATREVWREKPDCCHLHDLDLALAIPFIRVLTRAKIVYDSHEVFTEEDLLGNDAIPRYIRPVVARLVSRVERFFLRFCDHIVPAVEPTRQCFGTIGVPLTTVFNYPPLHLFETDSVRLESARREYRDRRPIIYQGSISRDRGLFHMIEALAIIKRAEPRILLRLVGMKECELMSEALRKAEELDVREAIEVVGWVPHNEVAYAMKTSLIGLVPLQPTEKYNRSLPIKLLEYMACGIPVVASNLPLIERYVKESGAGLLYDSTRPEDLASCVVELLADAERRRQMGDSGIRAALERWNWGRMEEVLLGVYKSLSSRRMTRAEV